MNKVVNVVMGGKKITVNLNIKVNNIIVLLTIAFMVEVIQVKIHIRILEGLHVSFIVQNLLQRKEKRVLKILNLH